MARRQQTKKQAKDASEEQHDRPKPEEERAAWLKQAER